MIQPTLDELIEIVKNHDIRIGMRMIYRRFFIPHSERPKYKKLWYAIHKELQDGNDSDDSDTGSGGKPDGE